MFNVRMVDRLVSDAVSRSPINTVVPRFYATSEPMAAVVRARGQSLVGPDLQC